jgi:hypothetical protein
LVIENKKLKKENKIIKYIIFFETISFIGIVLLLIILNSKKLKETSRNYEIKILSLQKEITTGTELEFVIMVIAVSCVKLLSAHNSTQHTSRKHKV